MHFLLTAWILSALTLGAQQSAVRVREDKLNLPTYDEGAPDPNPQFAAFSHEYFPNYPYTIRTPVNKIRHMTQWRAIILENEYLSCRVLPDLGGHLYGCTDKLSGLEMFYANPAVRRGPESTRGAFVAMGIESSFPFAHSRVGSSPVDYAFSESDGIARVIVEDTDRVSGMSWRDEFVLRPGSAVLEQRVTLYNGTPARRGFHWWANAAIEVNDPHLRFIYPVHWMLPHGDTAMTSWPVSDAGVDLSDLANHRVALGLFAHGSNEPWMAVYKPKLRSGVVHYADAGEVKGKKLWLWGPDDKYVMENLTEKFNSYVEMQAGLMETQPEFAFLLPGEVRAFTHYWIPVRDMGGISRATPDAVLNLARTNEGIVVEIAATHPIHGARIVIADGPKTLFETGIDLDPKAKYSKTFDIDARQLTVRVRDDSGKNILEYTEGVYDSLPFDRNGKVPAPEPPPPGAESEADVIARGSYNERRDQFAIAWSAYRTGLQKYPASEGILLGAGRTASILNRFDDALRLLGPLAAKGLPEACWYFGAALAATGRLVDATAAFRQASLDVRYTTPARLRMALLAAAAHHMPEAVATIQSSAAEPGATVFTGGFEVAILRRDGKPDAAKERLAFWLNRDPANNMLRAERVLLGLPDDASFWNHLAADPERILNLADSYFDLGAYDDALRFLDRQYASVPATETEPGAVLPQKHPMVVYHRGYARLRLGQDPAPDFKAASALSILYIFPSRTSSWPVLKAALDRNDADATAHALTGDLAMASMDPDTAILHWRKALSLKPDLPAVDEMLARALPKMKPEMKRDPAATSVAPAGDAAGLALVQSALDPDRAAGVFTNANFPNEKQPDNVRRAYIETQMQRLLLRAENGKCTEALPGLETLGDEDKGLAFSMDGFRFQMKAAHFQYYLAVIENACGLDKAAKKRWSKVSGSNQPAGSLEFAFPILAAGRLAEKDWRRRIAGALQDLKGDAPEILFARGVLLMAAGNRDEGDRLLQETSKSDNAMIRYLSLVALRENSKASR
jgi:tetratricopeptide (TPR) repeat protein